MLVKNNRLRAGDLARLKEKVSSFAYRPLLSILMPVLKPELRWLERTLDSAVRQIYPDWELRICCVASTEEHIKEVLSRYERLDERIKVVYPEQDAGAVRLSNTTLSMAGGEFACFLGEGDELAPHALLEVVRALQEHPGADLIYTDEDAIDEEGKRSEPRFKPGWSPDLLLSTNYISHLSVYRRSLVEELGGLREGFEGAHDHDLLLRLTERTDKIRHIPKVLYHRRASTGSPTSANVDDEARTRDRTRDALSEALKRRGLEGSVEDGLLPDRFRARPKIKGEPKVSIIIPTRDNVSLLKNGVESIERLTSYRNYEILIVDNDSSEPETLEYLASSPHRVVPFREAFNYSRINNFAVSHAGGEYVLLLNDDTEVISGGWLEAMLEHAQRPEVGAVGARLLYPDGRIQHAGAMTGIGGLGPGLSTHAYQFYPSDSPGHMGTLVTTTNYSAVTAACMLIPKPVYEEVGGLDEDNLPVAFNDVDLCLRIRERGYLIVYTPFAELYHYESASRGYKGNRAEGLYMRERWGKVLDEDSYYNPHFSRGGGDFNLRADLLRPRVLRQGRTPEDPASSSNSQLLTNPEERKKFIEILKSALATSPEGRKKFIESTEVQLRTARDSYRTTILPMRKVNSVRITALEGLEQDESPRR
jgi:GT2 family glycosyltransferase